MMDKIRNAIRAEVMRAIATGRAQTRNGSITSYDPATHMAKVMISPELVETGWLPVQPVAVGNGFGFYVGPNINDQVTVTHLQDDFESGMITGRVCDDDHVPPPVPSGEIWAVHASGSFLKFTNDGGVELKAVSELLIDAPQTTMTGNLTVEGNVDAGNGITATFTTPTGQVVTVQSGITSNLV